MGHRHPLRALHPRINHPHRSPDRTRSGRGFFTPTSTQANEWIAAQRPRHSLAATPVKAACRMLDNTLQRVAWECVDGVDGRHSHHRPVIFIQQIIAVSTFRQKLSTPLSTGLSTASSQYCILDPIHRVIFLSQHAKNLFLSDTHFLLVVFPRFSTMWQALFEPIPHEEFSICRTQLTTTHYNNTPLQVPFQITSSAQSGYPQKVLATGC